MSDFTSQLTIDGIMDCVATLAGVAAAVPGDFNEQTRQAVWEASSDLLSAFWSRHVLPSLDAHPVTCERCKGAGTEVRHDPVRLPGGAWIYPAALYPCQSCDGAGKLDSRLATLYRDASDLSYHNAAEGDCYFREAGARGNAQVRFDLSLQIVNDAGLGAVWAAKRGHYLI